MRRRDLPSAEEVPAPPGGRRWLQGSSGVARYSAAPGGASNIGGVSVQHPDDMRPVDLFDEGLPVLPDQTSDDTDLGWGDWRSDSDVSHLLEERPPHWD